MKISSFCNLPVIMQAYSRVMDRYRTIQKRVRTVAYLVFSLIGLGVLYGAVSSEDIAAAQFEFAKPLFQKAVYAEANGQLYMLTGSIDEYENQNKLSGLEAASGQRSY